jgi:hypothetical protein
MARSTKLRLNLDLQGFAPMRRAIYEAFGLLDADAAGRDPVVSTFTGTTGAITAAMFNRNGEAIILCSNGSAVALSMAAAVSDALPIGAKIFLHQGAGAVTVTFTTMTKTTRGVVTAGLIALAIKTGATTWTIQYPALAA